LKNVETHFSADPALAGEEERTDGQILRFHADQALPAPVLLTFAGYSGTLAAVRCLGRLGIPITVADPQTLVPAKWSRYVTAREKCPPIQRQEAFLHWILEFGEKNPGHVLYPTSDDMAWFVAQHREILSKYFRLYSPSIQSIRSLLDKRELYAVCRRLNIPIPETHCPTNATELLSIADAVEYPVLLKVTTQAFLPFGDKGTIVRSRGELVHEYQDCARRLCYPVSLLCDDPKIGWPMVQRYYDDAATGTYGLSGFVDQNRTLADFRASRKVLQYPRTLGIGVCFEEAEVVPELRDRVLAICQATDYWGVFEAEFIEEDGDFLLADFNPRYYSQMWFDVSRGMSLPEYAYLGAMGHRGRLERAVRRSQDVAGIVAGRVIVNRFMLRLMLLAKRLSRAMSAKEAAMWRAWYRQRAGEACDFTAFSGDRVPGYVDALNRSLNYLRHPRYFMWSVWKDG
jgi:predicted ATP-grasp superfamily ATP-dependent carboligase